LRIINVVVTVGQGAMPSNRCLYAHFFGWLCWFTKNSTHL